MLAESCGQAKCQCCTSTVTVVVYSAKIQGALSLSPALSRSLPLFPALSRSLPLSPALTELFSKILFSKIDESFQFLSSVSQVLHLNRFFLSRSVPRIFLVKETHPCTCALWLHFFMQNSTPIPDKIMTF